ncbi:MAG TPA: PqiC family protein [Caldimonas sp.]|nr:PqiC family protein [Caldimonas sp.]
MRDRLLFLRCRARAWQRAGLALGALLLAACGTPPPTHFHSLMPTELSARSGTPAASGVVVRLDPIRVPAQVDQPQWLVQLGDDSMAVLEQERWASPLRDEFQQALLEELIIGQGAIDARTHPAAGASAVRVAIDVRRFDSLPGREARIEGSWTITGGDARGGSRCDWLVREAARGSFPALAAAHRRAVARLGAALGPAIAGVRRGDAASCPALDAR